MASFWTTNLGATLTAASRIVQPRSTSPHVLAWLAGCDEAAPVSSNTGALELPFQRWMKFKEAFSPKFVVDALASLDRLPRRCLDPFGGSGTTALTCSLLGIEAVTIEVNPFLADLIEAKVTPLDPLQVIDAYAETLDQAEGLPVNAKASLGSAPASLREPGVGGRFVFWAEAIDRILALRAGIETIKSRDACRLLKVLLGSILVEASNVVVNGKGRRYRGGWQTRRVGVAQVDTLFDDAVRRAARDLAEYGGAMAAPVRVLRGDSRKLIAGVGKVDLALFSPPYPNSFDYTDVYNLELWVLGYLSDATHNRRLRQATLRSHVQVGWDRHPSPMPAPSKTLRRTLKELSAARANLWDSRIVEMVADYFRDMTGILRGLRAVLRPRGRVIMVVGDSCYAGVRIDTGAILCEIAKVMRFTVVEAAAIRSMRNSAQHGGQHELTEDCLVLAL